MTFLSNATDNEFNVANDVSVNSVKFSHPKLVICDMTCLKKVAKCDKMINIYIFLCNQHTVNLCAT